MTEGSERMRRQILLRSSPGRRALKSSFLYLVSLGSVDGSLLRRELAFAIKADHRNSSPCAV